MTDPDLSNFFLTKAQAIDFCDRLSAIIDNIYQIDFDLEKAFLEKFGLQKKDLFLTFIRKYNLNSLSSSELEQFLIKIKDQVLSMPELELTIAVEPNEEILRAIIDWIITNLDKQFLLNIKTDTKIIGGATIGFNGKYIDCSIRPTFDKVVKKVIDKILIENNTKAFNHQNPENIHIGR